MCGLTGSIFLQWGDGMTEQELKRAIVSATKTLNSRIRRLKNENLPSSVDARISDLKKFNHPFVTAAGYISGSTKGATLKQLNEKLKWIRGVLENTETVAEARELVERKSREWNVKKSEAARRIRAGRLFYQVLGGRGFKWDSEQVRQAMQEFEHTPSYDELENKLYEMFGADMQDTDDGAEPLREWMNEHDTIPPGVDAHVETNPATGQDEIIYDDEYFDENGEICIGERPEDEI